MISLRACGRLLAALLAVAAASGFAPDEAGWRSGALPLPSEESGDLLEAIAAIVAGMPPADSEGFALPDITELAEWRSVVQAMIAGDFSRADSLVAADLPFYELVLFTDTGFGDREYVMLREAAPVIKGWGALIANPGRWREVAIEVPHAIVAGSRGLCGAVVPRRAPRGHQGRGRRGGPL